MKESIKHTGKIIAIDERTIQVNIVALSACMSCKSQKVCGLSEKKDKIIEVPNAHRYSFAIGHSVVVETKESNAFLSVLLAYILPSVFLITSLIIALNLFKSEVIAAFVSLCITGIYFFILYCFRAVLSKKLTFTIKPE